MYDLHALDNIFILSTSSENCLTVLLDKPYHRSLNVSHIFQTQRPEIGIMQALESLNDTQVNEFLCGKAPLHLSMRLGDHMMLIQLQLSTVSGTSPPPSSGAPPPARPPSLMQASRNLQHTLRKLSANVFSERDEGERKRCNFNVYFVV